MNSCPYSGPTWIECMFVLTMSQCPQDEDTTLHILLHDIHTNGQTIEWDVRLDAITPSFSLSLVEALSPERVTIYTRPCMGKKILQNLISHYITTSLAMYNVAPSEPLPQCHANRMAPPGSNLRFLTRLSLAFALLFVAAGSMHVVA